MGEGREGSHRAEFGAQFIVARGCARFRGWDGQVTGQATAMAHYCGNLMSFSSLSVFTQFCHICYCFLCSTYYRLFYQATQLTHILDGRLKELAEDAMWEKALKDVAEATSKEKPKLPRPQRRRPLYPRRLEWQRRRDPRSWRPNWVKPS